MVEKGLNAQLRHTKDDSKELDNPQYRPVRASTKERRDQNTFTSV